MSITFKNQILNFITAHFGLERCFVQHSVLWGHRPGSRSNYYLCLIAIFLFGNLTESIGQSSDTYYLKYNKYHSYIDSARKFSMVGNYKISCKYYSKAIKIYPKKIYYGTKEGDLLNAAECFSLAGYTKKAFKLMNECYNQNLIYFIDLTDSNNLVGNINLSNLRLDKIRWSKIMKRCQIAREENRLNNFYKDNLTDMGNKDQSIRTQIKTVDSSFQASGDQKYKNKFDSCLNAMKVIDSLNIVKFGNLIKKFGWPTYDKVGVQGSYFGWLLVQHADLKFKMECLPLIKKAAYCNKTSKEYLAMLEDRICQNLHKKQIYGTQLIMVKTKLSLYPVINERNLDNRRKNMGLLPIKVVLGSDLNYIYN